MILYYKVYKDNQLIKYQYHVDFVKNAYFRDFVKPFLVETRPNLEIASRIFLERVFDLKKAF